MSVAIPAIFLKIDSAKFDETIKEDPALGPDTEGGYALTRPRYTRRPPRVFTLGFTDISDAEKQVVMSLYTDAAGGSEIITGWTHPATGEAIDVRFKKQSMPKAKYTGRGGNHRWNIDNIIFEEV